MNFRSSGLLFLVLAVVCVAWASEATSGPVSITGWVLDSACAITKGLDKPISRDCAIKCAKAGSPLRLFNDQLEAMQKLKGKTGQQRVTVEHVHVHKGGQAVVGTVATGRGVGDDTENQ